MQSSVYLFSSLPLLVQVSLPFGNNYFPQAGIGLMGCNVIYSGVIVLEVVPVEIAGKIFLGFFPVEKSAGVFRESFCCQLTSQEITYGVRFKLRFHLKYQNISIRLKVNLI